MKQSYTIQNFSKTLNPKLLQLNSLLQNSKKNTIMNSSGQEDYDNLRVSRIQLETKPIGFDMSKDLSFYLSLIEKPVNLLFSIDQFLFEFSKKTYQQKKTGFFFQQLKERKKFSLFYGHLTRKQILNLFNKTKKKKGDFSKNLLSLLERRLDVVLYRSGLLKTIREARQLIKHKKILVNERVINVPSFLLNPGDFVSIQPDMVDILSNKLVHTLKTKTIKNHPKIIRDFYSTLKKTLDYSPSFLSKKETPNTTVVETPKKSPDFLSTTGPIVNWRSRHLCKGVIRLLATLIKLRSYWNLNRDKFYPIHNSFQGNRSMQKNQFLILFKWKSLSHKKHFLSKNRSMNKSIRRQNNGEQVLYANGGCWQKKPMFWRLFLEKKEKTLLNLKKSQSITQQIKKNHPVKLMNFKKKSTALYRKSFLLFLKHLENSRKFTSLISLNMKKSLLNKSFYQRKSINKEFTDFSKNLYFRLIRPLNFEVSYNLLNLVYLYSPQRVNFPFYIDLDLIKRSLR